jgi:hypothetical protein
MAAKMTANDYLVYRALRVEDGISPKTCNNDLAYLNAVFNELHRTGEISYPNPFEKIRQLRSRSGKWDIWIAIRYGNFYRADRENDQSLCLTRGSSFSGNSG